MLTSMPRCRRWPSPHQLQPPRSFDSTHRLVREGSHRCSRRQAGAGRRAGGWAGRWAGGRAGRRMGSRAAGQPGGQAGRLGRRQAGRRVVGHSGRWAGGQAGRRAGRRADSPVCQTVSQSDHTGNQQIDHESIAVNKLLTYAYTTSIVTLQVYCLTIEIFIFC